MIEHRYRDGIVAHTQHPDPGIDGEDMEAEMRHGFDCATITARFESAGAGSLTRQGSRVQNRLSCRCRARSGTALSHPGWCRRIA